MSKVRDIIESLPVNLQKNLQAAFDAQEPYYIAYAYTTYGEIITDDLRFGEDGEEIHYIGVNVERFKECDEKERIGEYSLGRLRAKS